MATTMTEKKNSRGRGRPPKDSPVDEVQLQTRMPSDLRKAIKDYQESLEFPPQLNDIGVKAFQEFLEKRGFWPPNEESEAES